MDMFPVRYVKSPKDKSEIYGGTLKPSNHWTMTWGLETHGDLGIPHANSQKRRFFWGLIKVYIYTIYFRLIYDTCKSAHVYMYIHMHTHTCKYICIHQSAFMMDVQHPFEDRFRIFGVQLDRPLICSHFNM